MERIDIMDAQKTGAPPGAAFAAEIVALSELKRRRPKPQPSENEGGSGADQDDGEEDAV
jgi:hypothetical protein